jgi:hypothetical protein
MGTTQVEERWGWDCLCVMCHSCCRWSPCQALFPRHGPLLTPALLVRSGWRRDVATVGRNILLGFQPTPGSPTGSFPAQSRSRSACDRPVLWRFPAAAPMLP